MQSKTSTQPERDLAIQVQGLTKSYGKVRALRGIDLQVARGEIFGFLGPNGAGKTTTIEMMEGIISATSGEVYYKGALRTRDFNEEIGIQFQHTALLSFLTVRETLNTFQKLYRKTADINSLLAMCNLLDIQNQYNDKISGGQRQRLLLALALVNRPVLLFLDEPSTGLDPQARRNLWDIVLNIKSQGKTIILTTHYMEEAQLLCDEVAIMDYGRIIARGTVADLIREYCDEDGSGQPCPEANLETVFIKLTGRQLRE